MKYIYFVSISLFLLVQNVQGQVKISDNNNTTVNPNAILDLESDKLGILPPTVVINNLNSAAPLTAPVTSGMLVYSLGGSVADGYYYWNGTSWNKLTTGSGNNQWITNGTSIYYNTGNVGIGVSSPSEKLEVLGNVKIGDANTGTVFANKELVLRQDGDLYGTSILRLRNRTGENGAIFETTNSTTLVDFIFKTTANQRNIRYESRQTYAKTGAPSFHIGGALPDTPTLSVGDTYAAFGNMLKIGDYNTPLTALDVNGQITLRSGAFNGAVLVSDANGTGTWQETEHVVYLATDITTNGTGLANATGLSFVAEANKDYYVEFDIIYTTSNTGNGITLSVDGPANPAGLAFQATTSTSATAIIGRAFNAYNGGTNFGSSAGGTANTFATISGIFRNGNNAGIFILRFASENNTAVSIKAGSILKYQKLN